ncbi:MAG: translocation protein TolB [Desulfovibrio sp.]|jgi:TolB protein|nr:translocation protein TolB [Desulfovibrio sp.]
MIKNAVLRKRIGPGAAFLVCLLLLLPTGSEAAGPFTVQIVGVGGGVVNILQADPSGDTGRGAALRKAIDANLGLMPFLRVQSPAVVPGGANVASASGQNVDFKRFSLAQINLLITSAWQGPAQVELRCFSVADGSFMLGNRYSIGAGENDLLDAADEFCADFLDKVIGRGDFFRSVMAFVKSDGQSKKDIWSVQPNGRRLVRLTNMRGEALSPTWSPDGRRVLFTHIDKRSHGLGVCDTTSKSVQRIKFPGNTVIGPVYMPDGRVAVSLTDGRNPSIFLLGHSLDKQGRLDESPAIDVSPSVDATGSLMAFTSSRLGGPQVFLKDLRSGAVRRVSQAGSYNTDPSISPDGTMVAYARQEGGGHRIYVQDLVTGQERQVSFGPGSDEEPAFAPDSYFIAFMSTRGGSRGIYITTRNGGETRRLPTGPGDASFPAWGPSRKR